MRLTVYNKNKTKIRWYYKKIYKFNTSYHTFTIDIPKVSSNNCLFRVRARFKCKSIAIAIAQHTKRRYILKGSRSNAGIAKIPNAHSNTPAARRKLPRMARAILRLWQTLLREAWCPIYKTYVWGYIMSRGMLCGGTIIGRRWVSWLSVVSSILIHIECSSWCVCVCLVESSKLCVRVFCMALLLECSLTIYAGSLIQARRVFANMVYIKCTLAERPRGEYMAYKAADRRIVHLGNSVWGGRVYVNNIINPTL